MVKLVDTPDLGSGAARCEGSSPFTRTKPQNLLLRFFLYICPTKSITMKRLLLVLLLPFIAFSQIPAYYSDIDFTQSNTEIKEQIATLITTTHSNLIPYTSNELDTWDIIKQSDLENPNSINVFLIYGFDDTDAITKNDRIRSNTQSCHGGSCIGLWNREHVFAKSLANPSMTTDDPGIGTDVHNLRAADSQMNSSRNNRPFENATASLESTITSNGNWFPGDEWKGDVARIIMYMYLRYPSNCSATDIAVSSTSFSPLGDMPDLFLIWNEEDPVSEFEQNRNEVIYSYQGNRNPFIDNPHLAQLIWNGPVIQDNWGILNNLSFTSTEKPVFYPSLSTGMVYLDQTQNSTFETTIFNSLGQQILHTKNQKEYDLTNFQKGIYFIHFQSENLNYNQKIILK